MVKDISSFTVHTCACINCLLSCLGGGGHKTAPFCGSSTGRGRDHNTRCSPTVFVCCSFGCCCCCCCSWQEIRSLKEKLRKTEGRVFELETAAKEEVVSGPTRIDVDMSLGCIEQDANRVNSPTPDINEVRAVAH